MQQEPPAPSSGGGAAAAAAQQAALTAAAAAAADAGAPTPPPALRARDGSPAAASRAALNETAQQLAFADVILLNKTDLVTPEQLELVRREVRRVNGTARLVDCRLNAALASSANGAGGPGTARARAALAAAAAAAAAAPPGSEPPPAPPAPAPPVEELLGCNAFSVDRALQVDPAFLDSDSGDGGPEDSDVSEDSQSAGAAGGGEEGGSSRSEDGDEATATAAGGGGAAGSSGQRRGALGAGGASADSLSEMGGGGATGPTALPVPTTTRKQHPPSSLHHQGGRPGGAKVARSPSQSQLHEAVALATAGDRRPKRRRKQMHDLSGIGSVGIVARGPLDEYRFNMFMRDLLAEKARDIFRCKGVLAVHGYGDRKFVFQGVHETICYGPADKPWAEGEPRVNQIVFVGRGLDRRSLMEGFRTCVWTPLPEGWREFCDPVTGQPYYCHAGSGRKTWARPEAARPAAGAVTATRLQSFEQPRSSRPVAGGGGHHHPAHGSSLQPHPEEAPAPPQSRPAPPLGSEGTAPLGAGAAAGAAAAAGGNAPSATQF
jgi:G3E family GTPase